jgi:hypothetical protein
VSQAKGCFVFNRQRNKKLGMIERVRIHDQVNGRLLFNGLICTKCIQTKGSLGFLIHDDSPTFLKAFDSKHRIMELTRNETPHGMHGFIDGGVYCNCDASKYIKLRTDMIVSPEKWENLVSLTLVRQHRHTFTRMHSLKHLSLDGCEHNKFFGNFQLSSLRLKASKAYFLDSQLKTVTSAKLYQYNHKLLRKIDQLERLTIRAPFPIDDIPKTIKYLCVGEHQPNLASIIRTLNALEELIVEDYLEGEEALALFEACSSSMTLKHLSIDSFEGYLSVKDFNIFERLVSFKIIFGAHISDFPCKTNHVIEDLRLPENEFEDVKELVDRLKVLELHSHEFEKHDLTSLLHLRELYLCEVLHIGDDCKVLLEQSPNLRVFDCNFVTHPYNLNPSQRIKVCPWVEVWQPNWQRIFDRRTLMTLLMCLKPKDVLFSIAKEIKNWE